jgi:hypothetical protein
MNQYLFQNFRFPDFPTVCRDSSNLTDLRLLFCLCPIFWKRNFRRKNAQVLFARHGVNPALSMGRTAAADRSQREPFDSGGRISNAEWFEFPKERSRIPGFKTRNARKTAS